MNRDRGSKIELTTQGDEVVEDKAHEVYFYIPETSSINMPCPRFIYIVCTKAHNCSIKLNLPYGLMW
jgi:hypothetical protein